MNIETKKIFAKAGMFIEFVGVTLILLFLESIANKEIFDMNLYIVFLTLWITSLLINGNTFYKTINRINHW